MNLKTCSKEFVEKLIEEQPEGKNTSFLKSSHNLWYRFKNYDKQPPFALYEGNDPVAFVFITFSQRSKYANLYEIVTLEGMEGKGYASKVWEGVMATAYNSGMRRLKISCTPSSITWHKRNGLIFWAVDPSGSLRSDQPLFPTIKEQNEFRDRAIKDPKIAIPNNPRVKEQLIAESLESHKFGVKKTAIVEKAIADVGEYWLREALMEPTSITLDV